MVLTHSFHPAVLLKGSQKTGQVLAQLELLFLYLTLSIHLWLTCIFSLLFLLPNVFLRQLPLSTPSTGIHYLLQGRARRLAVSHQPNGNHAEGEFEVFDVV